MTNEIIVAQKKNRLNNIRMRNKKGSAGVIKKLSRELRNMGEKPDTI